MDPSIMQLLEDDEDKSMHSGADVDAFTAALNRDIAGTLPPSPGPPTLPPAEGSKGSDADKEKEEGRSKTHKINKEDDKMRTTAANVAARAAVGGDDMLSKWQLMAEQARQKREGNSSSSHKPLPIFGTTLREEEPGKRGFSAASMPGGMRKFRRSPVAMTHPKIARSISTKDVIAVLQREPQMSRSALLYRLYERMPSDSAAE